MLAGKKTVLRAPIGADTEFLVALRNDLATQMLTMAMPRANSAARVTKWLTTMLDDPRTVFFIIAARASGKARGYLQIRNMDFVHGFGELGICLTPAAQGRGHAREALQLIETYLRDVFALRKIMLQVMSSNSRAISLYLALGYAVVGNQQQHFYQSGTYHDVTLMEKFLVPAAADLE
jgi:RimJ/RimL family protein N-acetyltransferase